VAKEEVAEAEVVAVEITVKCNSVITWTLINFIYSLQGQAELKIFIHCIFLQSEIYLIWR